MGKRSLILLIVLQFLVFSFVNGETYEKGEEGYKKMRVELFKHFREKKYQEAADLLENHINKYPDHLAAMSFNLAIIYGNLDKHEKGIKALLKAQKKGNWYSIWALEGDFFKTFKKFKSFEKVISNNKKLHAIAESKVKSFYKIREPEKFDPEKKYPLFIALHYLKQ